MLGRDAKDLDALCDQTIDKLKKLIDDYESDLVLELKGYTDTHDFEVCGDCKSQALKWAQTHRAALTSFVKRYEGTTAQDVRGFYQGFYETSKGLLRQLEQDESKSDEEVEDHDPLSLMHMFIVSDDVRCQAFNAETKKLRGDISFITDLEKQLNNKSEPNKHQRIQDFLTQIEEHAQNQEDHLDSRWKWFLDRVYIIIFPFRGLYVLGKAIVNRVTYGAWDFHFFYHSKNREFDDKAREIINEEKQEFDHVMPARS